MAVESGATQHLCRRRIYRDRVSLIADFHRMAAGRTALAARIGCCAGEPGHEPADGVGVAPGTAPKVRDTHTRLGAAAGLAGQRVRCQQLVSPHGALVATERFALAARLLLLDRGICRPVGG